MISIGTDIVKVSRIKALIDQKKEKFLNKIFDEVVTFDDTGFHKPAKEPFIKIKELLDVEFHECLMVGDWPERDLEGAKSVGMKTAFASYGNSADKGIFDKADIVLDDISEIIEYVKKINKV